MQRLEVSGAVRPIYGSLGVKRLSITCIENYNDLKKISVNSLLILLQKAQAVVQKTSRKNVTSTVLNFFFFLSF